MSNPRHTLSDSKDSSPPGIVSNFFRFEGETEILSDDAVANAAYLEGKELFKKEEYLKAFNQFSEARKKIATNLENVKSQQLYLKIAFYIGQCYIRKKQPDKAVIFLDNILKKFSEEKELWSYVEKLELLSFVGKQSKLVTEIPEIKKSPHGILATLKRALELLVENKITEACELLIPLMPLSQSTINEYIEIGPIDTAEDYLFVVNLYQWIDDKIKNYEKSEKNDAMLDNYCKILINISPFSLSFREGAYYLQGTFFAKQDQYEKAVQSFSKAIKINPEETNFYLCRAKTYKYIKKYAEAKADLQYVLKKISNDPDHPHNEVALKELSTVEGLIKLQSNSRSMSDIKMDKTLKEKLIQRNKDFFKLNESKFNEMVYYTQGILLLRDSKFKEALTYFSPILPLSKEVEKKYQETVLVHDNSTHLTACENLCSHIKKQADQFENQNPLAPSVVRLTDEFLLQAKILFQIAWTDTDKAFALYFQAMFYHSHQNHAEAINFFDQSSALIPNRPRLYYLKALSYLALNNHQLVKENLEKVLQLNPKYSLAREMLVNINKVLKKEKSNPPVVKKEVPEIKKPSKNPKNKKAVKAELPKPQVVAKKDDEMKLSKEKIHELSLMDSKHLPSSTATFNYFAFEGATELLSDDDEANKAYLEGKEFFKKEEYLNAFNKFNKARKKIATNLEDVKSQQLYLKINFYLAQCYIKKNQANQALLLLDNILKKFSQCKKELFPYLEVLEFLSFIGGQSKTDAKTPEIKSSPQDILLLTIKRALDLLGENKITKACELLTPLMPLSQWTVNEYIEIGPIDTTEEYTFIVNLYNWIDDKIKHYEKSEKNDKMLANYCEIMTNISQFSLPYHPDSYFLQGKFFSKQDQFEKAIQSFNKAIEINENGMDFYLWRSRAYKDIKKYEAARADLQHILKKFPNNKIVKNELSTIECLIKFKNLTPSTPDKKMDKVLPYNQDFYKTQYTQGILLLKDSKFEEALTVFSPILPLSKEVEKKYQETELTNDNSTHLTACKNLCSYIKEQTHQWEARQKIKSRNSTQLTNDYLLLAKILFQIALSDEVKSIASTSQALFYYSRLNYTEAINFLNQSIALAPNLPNLYYYRGLSYLTLENLQPAKENFEKAIQIDQKNNYARQMLDITNKKLKKSKSNPPVVKNEKKEVPEIKKPQKKSKKKKNKMMAKEELPKSQVVAKVDDEIEKNKIEEEKQKITEQTLMVKKIQESVDVIASNIRSQTTEIEKITKNAERKVAKISEAGKIEEIKKYITTLIQSKIEKILAFIEDLNKIILLDSFVTPSLKETHDEIVKAINTLKEKNTSTQLEMMQNACIDKIDKRVIKKEQNKEEQARLAEEAKIEKENILKKELEEKAKWEIDKKLEDESNKYIDSITEEHQKIKKIEEDIKQAFETFKKLTNDVSLVNIHTPDNIQHLDNIKNDFEKHTNTLPKLLDKLSESITQSSTLLSSPVVSKKTINTIKTLTADQEVMASWCKNLSDEANKHNENFTQNYQNKLSEIQKNNNKIKILQEKFNKISLNLQQINPEENKTLAELNDDTKKISDIHAELIQVQEESKNYPIDDNFKEDIKTQINIAADKLTLSQNIVPNIYEAAHSQGKMEYLFDFCDKYNTGWKGGDSQLAGALLYSDIHTASKVKIKDSDGFIESETLIPFANRLAMTDCLSSEPCLYPSDEKLDKTPGKIYITKNSRFEPLQYLVYNKNTEFPITGDIKYLDIKGDLEQIESYQPHFNKILQEIQLEASKNSQVLYPAEPFYDFKNQLQFIKLSHFVNGKEFDLTIHDKNYKGNQFITGFASGRVVYSKTPLDEKLFDVLKISDNRYVGIDKKDQYYEDFKYAFTHRSYLVAPYQFGVHSKHSVVVVKNFKKMNQLFSDLKIDDKPRVAGDGVTKLVGYKDFLENLPTQFKTEMKNQLNENACYQEINALIKAFDGKFNDLDIQPFLTAFFDAVIFKQSGIKNADLTKKIIASLSNSYQKDPTKYDLKSKEMRFFFEKEIRRLTALHLKDAPQFFVNNESSSATMSVSTTASISSTNQP